MEFQDSGGGQNWNAVLVHAKASLVFRAMKSQAENNAFSLSTMSFFNNVPEFVNLEKSHSGKVFGNVLCASSLPGG